MLPDVPALIRIVSVINAAPSVVFDLELDVDVHTASLETAGRRPPPAPSDVDSCKELDGVGTQMIDRMTIHAPWGPLGAVMSRVLIAPHLRRLLKQRAAYIKYVAEARDRRRDAAGHTVPRGTRS